MVHLSAPFISAKHAEENSVVRVSHRRHMYVVHVALMTIGREGDLGLYVSEHVGLTMGAREAKGAIMKHNTTRGTPVV